MLVASDLIRHCFMKHIARLFSGASAINSNQTRRLLIERFMFLLALAIGACRAQDTLLPLDFAFCSH